MRNIFILFAFAFTLCIAASSLVRAQERDPNSRSRDKVQNKDRVPDKRQADPSRATRTRTRPTVQIKDPSEFKRLEGKPIFSGPQQGETLPVFKMIGVSGEHNGKELDPISLAGDTPQVIVFQDETGVGVRGLFGFVGALDKIRANSKSDLQFTSVFLGDDATKLTAFASRFSGRVASSVVMGVSPDGRDGPGNYGLNRNVAMTVLVAKGGKVVYNFAFTQPMLYPDAHVLGAVVEVLGEDRDQAAKWVTSDSPQRNAMAMRDKDQPNSSDPKNLLRIEIAKLVQDGKITREEAGAIYQRVFPAASTVDRMQPEQPSRDGVRRDQDRRKDGDLKKRNKAEGDRYKASSIPVTDPKKFVGTDGKRLFSGPQAGETLPAISVTGVHGENAGNEYDPLADSAGAPILLVFTDASELVGKTAYFLDQLVSGVATNFDTPLKSCLIMLDDQPDQVQKVTQQLSQYLTKDLRIAFSRDGRDGPGNYGLNRQIPVTMIVAKDGKVVHNFAFQNHVFQIDPYVAGAVAEVLNVKRETLASWLARAYSVKMTSDSPALGWIAWAKTASPQEIESALQSEKFNQLSSKDQRTVLAAIKKQRSK